MGPLDRGSDDTTTSSGRFLGPALGWGLFIFAALMPLAIMGLYCYRKSAQSVRQSIEAMNGVAALAGAQVVQQEFDSAGQFAQGIARLPETLAAVRAKNSDSLREQFHSLVEGSDRIDRILIADPNGRILWDYPAESGQSELDAAVVDWYRGLEQSSRDEASYYVSGVRRVGQIPHWVAAVAVPVRDPKARGMAILVTYVRMQKLSDSLGGIAARQDGSVLVVDHTGTLAAHPKFTSQQLQAVHQKYGDWQPVQQARHDRAEVAGRYRDPATGDDMFVVSRPITVGKNAWVVVAQQPAGTAEVPIHQLGVQLTIATIILAIAALAVIGGLGLTADRMRGLNEQLRQRARELAGSEQKLLRQTAILESVLSNMADGVVVADERGKFLSFNPVARRILGIAATSSPPADSSGVSGVYMADMVTPISPSHMPIMRAIRGEEVNDIEEFVRTEDQPDGRWISISSRPLRDDQDVVRGGVSVFRDITEQKRAQEALRLSEQRLQSILDNTTAVIYAKDRNGRYLLVNRQYEKLFHVTRDQVVGHTDHDFFPPALADVFAANDRKVLAARGPLEFDEVAPQDDGLHDYLSIKFPLCDPAGEPYAVCGISTDITDRKRTEEALEHERDLLHTLMDNVPDAIYFKDAKSRFVRINRALAEQNGLADPAAAIGKTDFDFFTPEHAQPALDDEQRVMKTGKPIVGKEEKETWPDGTVTWVLSTKLPLRDVDGKIVGTFGISRDITNRKRAEEALRDSEALYHSLVESLPLNVIRKDLDGRVTFGNSLYCKSMGKSLEELVGRTDYDLFPSELAEKYRNDDHRVTESGTVLETVEEHQTPRGEQLYVHVLKCPVFDSRAAIVGTQVIFWDVTARKRAEEALRNSESRYRQFTEGAQDAIVVADQAGQITLYNRAAQKTFGYAEQEVLGQPVTLLMPDEFREAHSDGLARFLRTRDPRMVGRTVELRGLRKNGEIFHMDLSLTALDLPEGVNFLAAIRDTTERHRLQNRLIQSEKMASLGLMSAGVAHEINNPLAFVANNLAVLDRDVKGMKCILAAYAESQPLIDQQSPELARKIAGIAQEIDLAYINQNVDRILDSTREGVKRVAGIVQNLRGFARLDQAAVDCVDVHLAIRSSLELIQGRLDRANITVEQRLGNLPPLACSPAQINQVFLNLLVNAAQAIEASQKPQGRIVITTQVAGTHVMVEISDDGCGIAPDLLSKIFDPFFTTKRIGEGTGLGLSITHGIVKDHNGEIEVESKPGEGSCFRVVLPIEPKPRS